jgi:hypothetical protein
MCISDPRARQPAGSLRSYELRAAIDAEASTSQPLIVFAFVTGHDDRPRIHDRAAIGAVTNQSILTAMIYALAEGGLRVRRECGRTHGPSSYQWKQTPTNRRWKAWRPMLSPNAAPLR